MDTTMSRPRTESSALKIRVNSVEAELIDSVRGGLSRGVWAHEVVMRVVRFGAPLAVTSLPEGAPRTITVGFRMPRADVDAVDARRGGFSREAWMRDAIIRAARTIVASREKGAMAKWDPLHHAPGSGTR